MKKTLIADAGSTKVEWVMIDSSGKTTARFLEEGMNSLLANADEVASAFAAVRKRLGEENVPEEIYFYGAGCATPRICGKIEEALRGVWPEAKATASSDLLGTARSLFADTPGIACILGTGSNSCLYDGKQIATNVPSLGYILGDEGSGAALGKRLVADAFKNHLPEVIREKFLARYNLSLGDILEKVYRSSAPNKFLASLVPFLKENLWNPYIYSLVHQEFTHFVKRNIAMYEGAHTLPVSFTGSIAYHFSDILREAAAAQGYDVDSITDGPMEGLIAYHINAGK
ncbi:MAG: hypothetical protein HDS70_02570 [Bacteroidales bacterium]|nr:hypothetical protein [Bacteroidales bacterium]